MKKITVKTFVPPIRFNSARLSLLAIVTLFAYFALPANAQPPNAFWQTDTSKIEFLSPQTNSRPDAGGVLRLVAVILGLQIPSRRQRCAQFSLPP